MVALRKESVDRNVPAHVAVVPAEVALRKESVDRNCLGAKADSVTKWSLSARRAWIEITSNREKRKYPESLSARRAWIEMQVFQRIAKPFRVALRKESVDRNWLC